MHHSSRPWGIVFVICGLCVLLMGFDNPEAELLKHIQTMTTLINENADDPQQTLKVVRAYVDNQDTELKEIGKAIAAKESAMNSEQRMVYQQQMETRFAPALDELSKALEAFVAKQPDFGDELSVIVIEFAVALDVD